jgi:hypothetical protein
MGVEKENILTYIVKPENTYIKRKGKELNEEIKMVA